MTTFDDLLSALAIEGDQLRHTVGRLSDTDWRTPTVAGWNVATQISHLAWTDEAALLSCRAAMGNRTAWKRLERRVRLDLEHLADMEAAAGAAQPPALLLNRWDAARTALPSTLRRTYGKLPWFGPPMLATAMATTRLMETWAHGLDVYEALSVPPVITDSIYHICHLGIATRDFAFHLHGKRPPTDEFGVALMSPGGQIWTWGPADAEQRIGGPAYDFARLVTQRIGRDDTMMTTVGPDAELWLTIAQAFAGPPGPGRIRQAHRI